MVNVIEALSETEARDELGLGGVRDALSDKLFPGTSTLQTRVRYFLFIPWIYRRLEGRNLSRSRMAADVRNYEVDLIYALLNGGEDKGVIGRDKREKLQRMPSSIYWGGLGAWGIRRHEQSQDMHLRSAIEAQGQLGGLERDEDGEPLVDGYQGDWHAGLPPEPEGFLEESTFSLTRGEAEYLQGRILASKWDTLLAFLVGRDHPPEPTSFPWELDLPGLSTELDGQVRDARNFSELMHGAALLYNLMVAKAARQEENIDRFEQQFSAWTEAIGRRLEALVAWDLESLWRTVASVRKRGARYSTQLFVFEWKRIVSAPDTNLEDIARDGYVHDLIRERERRLKRGWARLSSPRALELWGGESGAGQLAFRWGTAQRMLADIFEGLGA